MRRVCCQSLSDLVQLQFVTQLVKSESVAKSQSQPIHVGHQYTETRSRKGECTAQCPCPVAVAFAFVGFSFSNLKTDNIIRNYKNPETNMKKMQRLRFLE